MVYIYPIRHQNKNRKRIFLVTYAGMALSAVKDNLPAELAGWETFTVLDSSDKERLQSLLRTRSFGKNEVIFVSRLSIGVPDRTEPSHQAPSGRANR
jgi:hypothetical protein